MQHDTQLISDAWASLVASPRDPPPQRTLQVAYSLVIAQNINDLMFDQGWITGDNWPRVLL